MKMKFMWVLSALALLGACQDNEKYSLGTEADNAFVVSIDDASRTVINGFKVSFVEGDKIGITSGPNLNVESVIKTPKTGSTLYAEPITVAPFAVGDSLFAYYPYNAECDGKTLTFTIPAEQIQTDAEASHMTQYDVLVATPKVFKETKNSLSFSHTMAWMEFTVYNEDAADATIESVTIKARNKVFPTKATLNVTAASSASDYKVMNPGVRKKIK